MTEQSSPSYIKNTIYYTFIPLCRNLLVFVTLPIFTRYLKPADYGTLSLITMAATIISSIFSFNLNQSTYLYYYKYQDNMNALKAMFSTVLLALLASFTLGILFTFVLFPFVNQFLFDGSITFFWMFLALIQMLFMSINAMNQYLFQNRHEGKAWAQNEVAAVAVQVPLSILLVVTTSLTFEAMIISAVAAEFMKGIILFYRQRSYYGLVFKFVYLKEAAAYSWPIVPNMILSNVYTAFDKTMLNTYKGLSQVGLLDLSNRFTLILKMFMDGIGGTFTPVTLKLLSINTKESLEKLCDLNLKVVSLVLFMALGIIVFTQEVVLLLTTTEFHFAMYIVPIYIYNFVFSIVGQISSWLIRFPGKTTWTIPITISSIISTIIANILLIPKYGVIGVCIAAFISSAVSHILQYIIGMRITPIPMNNIKLFTIFIVMFIETAFIYFLFSLKLNLLLNFIAKLSLLSVFVGSCFFLKIITLNECKNYFTLFKKEIKNKFASLRTTRGLHSFI